MFKNAVDSTTGMNISATVVRGADDDTELEYNDERSCFPQDKLGCTAGVVA